MYSTVTAENILKLIKLERLIELKSVTYSEPAQCSTCEEVLLQNEHIRDGWKEPRVSLWQQSQRCRGCRQHREPEQPGQERLSSGREAALLPLQGEVIGNSLGLTGEESGQGSTAGGLGLAAVCLVGFLDFISPERC